MPFDLTTFDASALEVLAKASERDIAELDAQHKAENESLPLILAANAPEPVHDSAYYHRACENICKLLDSLLDEAYEKNNSSETPLTREEFSEYTREFERLKHILGEEETKMRVSLQFEAIENADDRPRN